MTFKVISPSNEVIYTNRDDALYDFQQRVSHEGHWCEVWDTIEGQHFGYAIARFPGFTEKRG